MLQLHVFCNITATLTRLPLDFLAKLHLSSNIFLSVRQQKFHLSQPLRITYTQSKPHFSKKKHDRSSSITDKWQSNPGIGNRIGYHRNIQDNLNRQMSHDTSTDERTRQIFCAHGSYTQTPEQNSKQKNKKGSSCNSHLFTYD